MSRKLTDLKASWADLETIPYLAGTVSKTKMVSCLQGSWNAILPPTNFWLRTRSKTNILRGNKLIDRVGKLMKSLESLRMNLRLNSTPFYNKLMRAKLEVSNTELLVLKHRWKRGKCKGSLLKSNQPSFKITLHHTSL